MSRNRRSLSRSAASARTRSVTSRQKIADATLRGRVGVDLEVPVVALAHVVLRQVLLDALGDHAAVRAAGVEVGRRREHLPVGAPEHLVARPAGGPLRGRVHVRDAEVAVERDVRVRDPLENPRRAPAAATRGRAATRPGEVRLSGLPGRVLGHARPPAGRAAPAQPRKSRTAAAGCAGRRAAPADARRRGDLAARRRCTVYAFAPAARAPAS
jgi:hypothetical protein